MEDPKDRVQQMHGEGENPASDTKGPQTRGDWLHHSN